MGYEFNIEDVFGLANSIHANVSDKGSEIWFKYCPYCNGSGHDDWTFSVNKEKGIFKCFRASCDKSGHFVELARDFNYPLDFGDKNSNKKYRRLTQKKIIVRDGAVEYMKSRGISEEVSRKYEVTLQANNNNVLVFPFFDDKMQMVSAKYRKINFDKSKDKGKEWFERDTMPVLFGIKQCTDFNAPLIITEGQIDALSVAEAGFVNATSVPNGANGMTWINNCYDFVNRFKEIVIFGDCENGKITLVDSIASRFPNKLIRIVRQSDYLGEKDANDILKKFGKEAIKYCINNAEIKPVKAVKRLCDVKAVNVSQMGKVKTGIRTLDRVIGGLFYGNVCLLTGKRGEGKSTLASQIIANAIEQDVSCFVYSGELTDYHFKNWLDLQIAGAKNVESLKDEYGDNQAIIPNEVTDKINLWYSDKVYIYDNTAVLEELAVDGKINEDLSLLNVMQQAVCRYGIKLVLLDNLMTAIDDDVTSDVYQKQSKFIKRLKHLAQLLDIAIILVAHPRKTQGELDNDSVSGSSDITNAVDVVLTYAKNDENDTEYQSLVGITKNRLMGKTRTGDKRLKMKYDSFCKRIDCADTNFEYSCFKAKQIGQVGDFFEGVEML